MTHSTRVLRVAAYGVVLASAVMLWAYRVEKAVTLSRSHIFSEEELATSKSLGSNFDSESMEARVNATNQSGISFSTFRDYAIDTGDQAWVLGILVVITGLGVYWFVKRLTKGKYSIRESIGTFLYGSKPIAIDFRDTPLLWSRFLEKTGVAVPMIGFGILAWIFSATALVGYLSHWPPGQSFFFVINSGFQRDFHCPFPDGPNLGAGRTLTFVNKLVGAIIFSTALVFFLNSLMENIKGDAKAATLIRCADNAALRECVGELETGGPFKTIAIDTAGTGVANGIGIDTTGNGLVDTVVIKPPAVFFTFVRINLGVVTLVWQALGVAYGRYFEHWDLSRSLTFAVMTLTIGGSEPLSVDEDGRLPESHAWALGVWIMLGVPLFATTVAAYTSFLVEANMREHDQRSLREPISMEDYEIARRIIRPDTTLDRAEFVILQLLRMGKTDLTTVALILDKFDEIDLDGDNVLTEEEVLACMAGRQVSGYCEEADGRRSHMDFSIFYLHGGKVLGRGEDRAGPFEVRGTYDSAAGRIAMEQFRIVAGSGGGRTPRPAAAGGRTPRRYGASGQGGLTGRGSARGDPSPPVAIYEGTIRSEGADTVIEGTWTPAPPSAHSTGGGAGSGGEALDAAVKGTSPAAAATAAEAEAAAAEKSGGGRGFMLRVRGTPTRLGRRFIGSVT